MALFYLVFAGLFGWSAYLQTNDPDPELWITVYCFFALLCVGAMFKKYSKFAILLGLVVCAYLGYQRFASVRTFLNNDDGIGFADTMSNQFPYIEESREFGGVAISAFVLLVMLASSLRAKSGGKKPKPAGP